MLDFKPVTLSDRKWMYPIIYSENIRNADFSFVNIYAWGASYSAKCTVMDGCLVICTKIEGLNWYSYPLGVRADEELGDVIRRLMKHCAECGEKLRLQSIHPSKLPVIESLFPGAFDIKPSTDLFDYVYSAEKLISLSGKKRHAKRNFVNRFMSEHSWRIEPMTKDNVALTADMDGEWITEKDDSEYDTAFAEAMAIRTSLRHFDELELDGAFLYDGDTPCAFTIGERICRDTYVVHFEKAEASIAGAYPMINREFVRMIKEKYPEIEYINREDDMGLENLRKAKQSYYPEFMEEKYTAVMR